MSKRRKASVKRKVSCVATMRKLIATFAVEVAVSTFAETIVTFVPIHTWVHVFGAMQVS